MAMSVMIMQGGGNVNQVQNALTLMMRGNAQELPG